MGWGAKPVRRPKQEGHSLQLILNGRNTSCEGPHVMKHQQRSLQKQHPDVGLAEADTVLWPLENTTFP